MKSKENTSNNESFLLFIFQLKFQTILTGAAVVVATGAKGVVNGLVGVKRDVAEKPVEVGAAVVVAGIDPKEIGAGALVPNGVVVDGPGPNVNDGAVALGRAVAAVVAGVEPNPNIDG
jgi:hypothetical protein